jgi:hypothetical protein
VLSYELTCSVKGLISQHPCPFTLNTTKLNILLNHQIKSSDGSRSLHWGFSHDLIYSPKIFGKTCESVTYYI